MTAQGESWTFVRPSPALQRQLMVAAPAMPVRSGRVALVLGQEEMDVDGLLDELDAFLGEHPDARPLYREFAAVLCYAHGIAYGRAGHPDHAADFLRRGLEHDPGNLALLSNYVVALWGQGKVDEAVYVAQAIVAHPAVAPTGPFWMIAARMLADLRRYEEALQVLEDLLPTAPTDPLYWDLLGAMAEKAERQPRMAARRTATAGRRRPKLSTRSAPAAAPSRRAAGRAARPPARSRAKAAPPARAAGSCAQCGQPLKPGAKFCNQCGAEATWAPACVSCGAALRAGAKFCAACGARQ